MTLSSSHFIIYFTTIFTDAIYFHQLCVVPLHFSPIVYKTSHLCSGLQGCSSPLVVKFADTQRDKEQRRLQQQLVHQIQQLNNASTWGNLAGLGTLTPQYLAVSLAHSAERADGFTSKGDFRLVVTNAENEEINDFKTRAKMREHISLLK